ncbi:hypothetical protein Brsp02_01027 [Brucella sp. NBRC 113783]
MTPSVRLGFIGLCQCISDKIRKSISKLLRENEIHPQARTHMSFRLVCPVRNGGGEGQGNNAVRLAVFNEKIGNNNGNTRVDNIHVDLANSENLSALNRNVVTHNSPLLKNRNASIGRNFATDSQLHSSAVSQAPRAVDEKSRDAALPSVSAPSHGQD